MAKYLVILQNPDGSGRDTFRASNHRRIVRWARDAHRERGVHITITKIGTGNVVLWLGTNFAKR